MFAAYMEFIFHFPKFPTEEVMVTLSNPSRKDFFGAISAVRWFNTDKGIVNDRALISSFSEHKTLSPHHLLVSTGGCWCGERKLTNLLLLRQHVVRSCRYCLIFVVILLLQWACAYQWEGELKLLRASGVLMVLFHVTLCESEAHSQTCPYGSVICKICHAKKMWIKTGRHIYSAFSSVFLFKDFWLRVKQRLCLLFMSTEHDFTLLLLSHWWSFTEQTITAVLLRARHWSGQVGTHQWITQGEKKSCTSRM